MNEVVVGLSPVAVTSVFYLNLLYFTLLLLFYFTLWKKTERVYGQGFCIAYFPTLVALAQ